MIARLAVELGPWSWWLLGMLLLAAELIAPGVFLVWIGMAAIVSGLISLTLWESALWGWQVQLLVFAFLSVIITLAGRRIVARHDKDSDEPLLNQRTASLVGRTSVLEEPLAEGRGRIRLDDTWWPVLGPDLPAGTRIRVVASHGRDLTVEAV